jgi:UDP-N-acetylmuramyl tripeptide synthase
MDLRCLTAIISAKGTKIICKLLKHDGTSLPGRVALKIDSRILAKLSYGMSVIMVTGTNGKTTTTGMISQILNEAGMEHIVNKSGANLIGGIASAFIDSVDVRGKNPKTLALIEVDEATVNKVTDSLQPDVLVVTNFFRDQLDRYGELYSVVDKVRSGIKNFSKAKLVLNADDSLCVSLGVETANETVFFGVESGAVAPAAEQNVSSASYCTFCQGKYDFSYRVLGHLGGYKCPNCGFKRPDTQITCTQVKEQEAMSSTVRFEGYGNAYIAKIGVPGLFNVYNALATTACCHVLGLSLEKTVGVFERFESCFGRMEAIHISDDKRIMLILAKNSASFNQIINYLSMEKKRLHVSFVINDRVQDGTDVSWLWDVDFERMGSLKNGLANIYTSGIRAEDMALRLKYAGIPIANIRILKKYRRLIDTGLASVHAGDTFFIVATYSAMMDIRRILKERYALKEIGQ